MKMSTRLVLEYTITIEEDQLLLILELAREAAYQEVNEERKQALSELGYGLEGLKAQLAKEDQFQD
jgi:hypothetical protein